MMEAAFRGCSIDARYVLFEVEPEQVGNVVMGARALGISGLNVTTPYKLEVVKLLDVRGFGVEGSGAVNTILMREGLAIGLNTDALGLWGILVRMNFTASGKTALIYGAGGAARAAAYILTAVGAKVYVFGRTEEKVRALRDLMPSVMVCTKLFIADILVNATSAGADALELPPPRELFINYPYGKGDDGFLEYLKASGVAVLDGHTLLLYQGMITFQLWTGFRAPEEIMRRAVEHSASRIHGRRKN